MFPFLGVRFISVNDNYDTNNPENNSECLAIALKSLINDVYAKDISRKVTAALEIKQQNGEFIGNHAAYGYLKSPEDKHKLIVDIETAPIVQNIFCWKIEGMGNNAIARKLNDLGIASPSKYRYEKGILTTTRFTNSLWKGSAIKNILLNPVYTGCMSQGKQKTRLMIGLCHERTKSDRWINVENTHEAIITHETFDRVQEILQSIKAAYHEKCGVHADKGNQLNIFKGLISCGDCGVNLSRYKDVNKKGRVRYSYICPNYEQQQTRLCPQRKDAEESMLIETVWSAICAEIDLSVKIERLVLKVQNRSKMRSRAKTIKEQIAEAKRKIERTITLSTTLYYDYSDGILTETEYLFAKAKYRKEKQLWEQQLDELIAEESKHTNTFVYDNKWIAALAQFRDSKELTREMLVAVVDKVIISGKNKIGVVFKHCDEYEALILHLSESGVSVSV